jgi:hypothetical protein
VKVFSYFNSASCFMAIFFHRKNALSLLNPNLFKCLSYFYSFLSYRGIYFRFFNSVLNSAQFLRQKMLFLTKEFIEFELNEPALFFFSLYKLISMPFILKIFYTCRKNGIVPQTCLSKNNIFLQRMV